MSRAFSTVYAALNSDDPEFLTILRDNWACMDMDEKQFLRVAVANASKPVTSEGGFDAEDEGKVAVFGADGGLSLTNRLTIYEGAGHTNYWSLGTSGIDGERDQTPTNGNGKIPLLVADWPADENAAGEHGMFALKSDGTRIAWYVDALSKWRFADLVDA